MMILSNSSPSLFYIQPEDELPRTVRKMHAFQRLKHGWHYGEGDPIEETVVQRAVAFHAYAMQLGFYETDAFPSIDGGIILTIYRLPTHLEFVFLPDGSAEFRRETDDTVEADEENLTDDAAKKRLNNFRHEQWTQSEFSTSSTTTLNWDVSYLEPSQTIIKAFRFSMSDVSWTQAPVAVTISDIFIRIQDQQVSRPFIGTLLLTCSPLPVN